MPKVLIISPYFPPANTADMQRVRMSLPYFKQYGWEAEVMTVENKHTDTQQDKLLVQSVPTQIIIHEVHAWDKKWTSKLGLGSLALRSMWFYWQKVNHLLKTQKFDLIYFSTTQFPLCILGNYWNRRFGIPYVIDMQDPWHSDYYQDKPKAQQPPKYWFSYRLNKYLEPMAMKRAGGLISVSKAYITTLQNRYPRLSSVPSAVITFGAFAQDFVIAENNKEQFTPMLSAGRLNIVYVGRGGKDMHRAIRPVFEALKKGLANDAALFEKLHFYFIGTSYAPAGKGQLSIMPLALEYEVAAQVTEISNRISFYHTLHTLQQADALFVPGSDDPQYTASKIYPYLLTQKPLLAVFHEQSSVPGVIENCSRNATLIRFSDHTPDADAMNGDKERAVERATETKIQSVRFVEEKPAQERPVEKAIETEIQTERLVEEKTVEEKPDEEKERSVERATETEINTERIYKTLYNWAQGHLTTLELTPEMQHYTAENMTRQQTELFNQVIKPSSADTDKQQ